MLLRYLFRPHLESLRRGFRRAFLPYGPPLTHDAFKKECSRFEHFLRFLTQALLANALPDTFPLWAHGAFFLAVQVPILAVYWVPVVVLGCRRLQGVGIGVPYLGWVYLAVVLGLFFLTGAYRGFYFSLSSIPIAAVYIAPFAVMQCLPFIPRFSKDNPVHGVGIFSRTWHDDTANNPEKGTLRQ